MRVLPAVIISSIVILLLAGVAALVVSSPTTQTWYLQRALERHPQLHATIESAELGFSTAHLGNVTLIRGNATLTAPSVDVRLPVAAAVTGGVLKVDRLTAHGWTLDLTTPAAPTAASASTDQSTASPSTLSSELGNLERALPVVVGGLRLPANVSAAEADLDGDVVLGSAGNPVRWHLILKGGPIARQQTGRFTIHASAPFPTVATPNQAITLNGELTCALDTAGAVNAATLEAHAHPAVGPSDFEVTASVEPKARPGQAGLRFELSRGKRALIELATSLAGQTVAGDWSLNLTTEDVGSLPGLRFARIDAAAGKGQFSYDAAGSALHASGHLDSTIGKLDWLPAGPSAIAVHADFEVTHRADAFEFARLHVAAGVTDSIVVLDSAQPFTIDKKTGRLSPREPKQALARGSARDFPANWLPEVADRWRFSGGSASGEFTIHTTADGIAVHSIGPIDGRGLAISSAGRTVAKNFDLAAMVEAEVATKTGWEFHFAPATVRVGGQQLLAIEGKISLQRDAYGRIPVTGTWTANLEAWRALPAYRWLRGQSAHGTFTANLGEAGDFTGDVSLTGRTPGESASAKISASIDDYHKATFQIPLQLGAAPTASDLSLAGSLDDEPDGQHLDLTATGSQVSRRHLEHLAAALLASLSSDGEVANDDARPIRRPFWGSLVGRVRFDFRRVDAGKYPLEDVGGTIVFEPLRLGLNGGRAVFNPLNLPGTRRPRTRVRDDDPKMEPRTLLAAAGGIAFDPSSPAPYVLKATAQADQVEAWRLLGLPADVTDPTIEGQFTISAALTGRGKSAEDLLARHQEELHVSSKAGIVRFLKTNVADAFPAPPSGTSDTLAGVGHVVGSLFGMHEQLATKVKLNAAEEAVLAFSYDETEIGYDQLTLTATRLPDRTIRLSDLSITSPREHITGSGQLGVSSAPSIGRRPLSLDLTFAFQGTPADRLKAAGLLSPDQDSSGYLKMRQAVRFGGTLEHIDNTAWHDLLASAALHPPSAASSGSPRPPKSK